MEISVTIITTRGETTRQISLSYTDSKNKKEHLFYARQFVEPSMRTQRNELKGESGYRKSEWLLDSGASRQMSCTDVNAEDYKGKRGTITTANGDYIQSSGTASIDLIVRADNSEKLLKLDNVLISHKL